MANFTFSRALINTSFKSLSVITVAIAACRLAFQYNVEAHSVDYISLTFWLVVEAATAVIAASISTYRIVLLDYLADLDMRQGADPALLGGSQLLGVWKAGHRNTVATTTNPPPRSRLDSQSELTVQQSTRSRSSTP